MTGMNRFIIVLILQAFLLAPFAWANDWATESGGISEDKTGSLSSGAFLSSGTGYYGPTASVYIGLGTGNEFFKSTDTITPTVSIYSSGPVTAQIAVVLGVNPSVTVYHDPDNFLTPWYHYVVDVYVDGDKDITLFSLPADSLANIIPGSMTFEPFGVFVRVLANGTVLDEASAYNYVLSPNASMTPVNYPSW